MNLIIRNSNYKVIKDEGETLSTIDLNDYVTDFYDNFDYIVGDWAYGKLRLKGFYYAKSKFVKKYNNYDNVKDYIAKNCAYGCKYFILEKVIENSK